MRETKQIPQSTIWILRASTIVVLVFSALIFISVCATIGYIVLSPGVGDRLSTEASDDTENLLKHTVDLGYKVVKDIVDEASDTIGCYSLKVAKLLGDAFWSRMKYLRC